MKRPRVARALSLVLAPQLYGGLIGIAAWSYCGVGGLEALVVLLVSQSLLPTLFIVADAARGKIDVFVSRREKRWKYFVLSAASYLCGAAYFHIRCWREYALLCLSYAATTAALAVVTTAARWKISVHTAGIAGPTTAIVLLQGPYLIPLYLLLIPTAWARYVERAHTLSQLVAGALLAFTVTVLVYGFQSANDYILAFPFYP